MNKRTMRVFRVNFLALAAIPLSLTASAQYDSTKVRQQLQAYGYDWKNGKFRNSLIIPATDTITMAVADSGAVKFYHGALYYWNGYTWISSGGSGSTNTSIGSAYKIAVNGTNNVKSLSAGWGAILDSATTGQVGVTVDSNAVKTVMNGNYWKDDGNSGTTAGTNFIGTTDAVNVVFKRGGVQSGLIDSTSRNTTLGYSTLTSLTNGNDNTAVGFMALKLNNSGYLNTAIGSEALLSNTTSNSNVALGRQALYSNTQGSTSTAIGSRSLYSNTGTGQGNIGVGYNAGFYNTTQSSRLYINSLARANILGDTTESIIYGAQDATAANQRLYLNSKLYLPYIPTGVLDTVLYYNPTSKEVSYGLKPSGGGSGTVNSGTQYRLGYYAANGTAISEAAAITANRALISDANGVPTHSATTATELGYVSGVTSAIQTQLNTKLSGNGTDAYVPYYTAATTLGNSDNFKWNYTNKILTLDSNTYSKNINYMLGNPSVDTPTMIQMRRNVGGNTAFTGSMGALGSTEMNMSVNMDYRTSSHKYYDSTKQAMWWYLGNTTGMGIQYVPAGNTNSNIYTNYGKEIFNVDMVGLQNSTGSARRFMSRVNSAVINLVDQGGTNWTSSTNDIELKNTSGVIALRSISGASDVLETHPIRIAADGVSVLAHATDLATFTTSATDSRLSFENYGNNSNSNIFNIRKRKASSYNIGVGTKILEFDYQGGIAYNGARATATVAIGSISNAEFYWQTTNAAGSTADRMILSEEGNLSVTGDVTVADEAYGAGWDGSLEVPTKNAVYDKIQTLGGSGITVGTTTITSGTSGAIPFNSAGVYGEDATQLFWDNSNNRLGVGTNGPAERLDVNGNSVIARAANSGATAVSYLMDETASNYFAFQKRGSAAAGNMGLGNGALEFINYTGSSMGFMNYGSGHIAFGTFGANERMRIDADGNVGINQTSPTSKLHTTSFATAYTATATNLTLTIAHNVVEVTATGQTITLPAAAGITGRVYTIKLTAAGSCTVDGNASETIDGATTYSLASQYKYVTIQSNGANWIVIANN